jgi:hypothetical protein
MLYRPGNSTNAFKQKAFYNNTKHLATFTEKPVHYYFFLTGLSPENPRLYKVEVGPIIRVRRDGYTPRFLSLSLQNLNIEFTMAA